MIEVSIAAVVDVVFTSNDVVGPTVDAGCPPTDGTPIRVRPIAPKDKQRLAEGWKQLSDHSRYLRFMQAKPTLGESELVHLTEIDY